MKKNAFLALKFAVGMLFVSLFVSVGHTAQAQGIKSKVLPSPIVFQASRPTAESIEGTLDEFRAALAARGENGFAKYLS